ncbi:MAG TPA: hypothetical protein VL096_14525 [Pirellulaceae bacterium]|nr:hypothetical protein [Pirellulaceae bacterium]
MQRTLAVCSFIALFLVASLAQAADDPTGTWKWKTTFGKTEREVTLKLKLEGDKLTGSMPGRNNQETAIEEGSFKDGTVSFKVTREGKGAKITSKYSAKLSGDTLKGTVETDRDGKTNSRDFEATRSKE